jgi:hypothetical protein
MWVDTGPRDLGDIVDAVLAGATTLTLRPPLWPSFQLNQIRDITENRLFLEQPLINNSQNPSFTNQHADGVVIFPKTPQEQREFKHRTRIKTLSTHTKLYVFLSDPKQIASLESLGVTGILVELHKLPEFKKHVL